MLGMVDNALVFWDVLKQDTCYGLIIRDFTHLGDLQVPSSNHGDPILHTKVCNKMIQHVNKCNNAKLTLLYTLGEKKFS